MICRLLHILEWLHVFKIWHFSYVLLTVHQLFQPCDVQHGMDFRQTPGRILDRYGIKRAITGVHFRYWKGNTTLIIPAAPWILYQKVTVHNVTGKHWIVTSSWVSPSDSSSAWLGVRLRVNCRERLEHRQRQHLNYEPYLRKLLSLSLHTIIASCSRNVNRRR